MSRIEDHEFRVAVIITAKRAPWMRHWLEQTLTFSVTLKVIKKNTMHTHISSFSSYIRYIKTKLPQIQLQCALELLGHHMAS